MNSEYQVVLAVPVKIVCLCLKCVVFLTSFSVCTAVLCLVV